MPKELAKAAETFDQKLEAEKLSRQERLDWLEVAKFLEKSLDDLYVGPITDVLDKAISAGASNVFEGAMGLMLYADLLHGGRYRAPSWTLPFYRLEIQTLFEWQEQISGGSPIGWIVPVPITIQMPDGRTIQLPKGTRYHTAEAIINSAEPHVLPKLISDEVYGAIREWIDYYMTLGVVKGVSTAVSTIIQPFAPSARRIVSRRRAAPAEPGAAEALAALTVPKP